MVEYDNVALLKDVLVILTLARKCTARQSAVSYEIRLFPYSSMGQIVATLVSCQFCLRRLSAVLICEFHTRTNFFNIFPGVGELAGVGGSIVAWCQ